MAKCSLSDWQAENLRLSAFVVNIIDPTKRHFWEPLIGTPPNEIRHRPQQQLILEEGPFLNGRLCVEVANNRVDWRLLPDLNNPPLDLPTIGSYDVLESGFRELMQRWLADCPPVHRLAYGGVLLLPAESLPDALRRLDELLPTVRVEPEVAQDFMYRINKRRDSRSGIEGLKINRLSTWAAVQVIETRIHVSEGDQGPLNVTHLPNSRGLCRLEIDINTIPEFNQRFDKNMALDIFNELVDIGNEIATEGDVT